MIDNDLIYRAVEQPASLTPADLELLAREYPSFIYPAVCALAEGKLDAEQQTAFRRLVAVNLSDRDALENILGDTSDLRNFYPVEEVPHLSTDQTIDSFLDKFSKDTPSDDVVLQQMMGGAAEVSLISDLEKLQPIAEEPQQTSEHQEIEVVEETPEASAADNAPDSTPLTESLARIMIKKRNFSKALEIITALSLNNPEKSVYFADQIRFLRKLIINENKS